MKRMKKSPILKRKRKNQRRRRRRENSIAKNVFIKQIKR